MRAVQLIIHGRVQGVGYRYFAQKRANQFGIAGYVRNLPDGSVEVQAQGKGNNLDTFIESLRQGPSFARVLEVTITDGNPVTNLSDFTIKY
jgi:acylphosphatase